MCSQGIQTIWLEMVLFSDIINLNIKQLQHQLQFRTLFEENTTLKRLLELAEQG